MDLAGGHPSAAGMTSWAKRLLDRRTAIEKMSSKQRALDALAHKETDRVPIDFWAAREVQADLAEWFGCEYGAFLDLVGVDFRVHPGPSYVGLELERHSDGTVSDLWGVRRIKVPYGEGQRRGSYDELASAPLAQMTTIRQIDDYQGWPSPEWWDYSRVAEECRLSAGKCVVFAGDRLDRTAQLKTAMYLRGVQQILLDLVENPEIVESILDHVTEYYLTYNERVFQAADGEIDVFMMGDDFGTQNGPFVGVEMWKRYFESNFRKHIALAHRYGIQVMHHSCGSIEPLIPQFIDAGLDILQSLQPRAAGMDLAQLKERYGKYLAFHGSIDIQHTMPFGTPMDVRREVQTRLQIGKAGGGFVICTAHNLQRDVPLENIVALLEAYYEYGAY